MKRAVLRTNCRDRFGNQFAKIRAKVGKKKSEIATARPHIKETVQGIEKLEPTRL